MATGHSCGCGPEYTKNTELEQRMHPCIAIMIPQNPVWKNSDPSSSYIRRVMFIVVVVADRSYMSANVYHNFPLIQIQAVVTVTQCRGAELSGLSSRSVEALFLSRDSSSTGFGAWLPCSCTSFGSFVSGDETDLVSPFVLDLNSVSCSPFFTSFVCSMVCDIFIAPSRPRGVVECG